MIILHLFVTFFKIGLFTIGGGYAMIPLIQQEVMNNGWMTNQQLIDFIAVSESTPGSFAINISTFVGMTRGGLPGAIAATLGVLLPSAIIILLIARFFVKFSKKPIVEAAFYGIRPAVIGLVGSAALSVFLNSFIGLSNPGNLLFFQALPAMNWDSLVIMSIVLIISLLWKKMHPIWLIGISGALGVCNHILRNLLSI